ncbi:TetR/AcrR family transcriptional regulator [Novosphingobium pentaromativorans]|uniref:TetR/AcrR family transcriptional regulator n=1 Tax=Novosphingobium pentaromativorans TaxID=205844 RepID=UPI00031D2DBF|nr:TetR/AcrR family transcriptional regulator [Novosphingobium pentaromativorans]
MGRDVVLATARRLLQSMPPARVTISLIAREAGIDPALVRYYFGDRSNLLLAVVDDMLGDIPRDRPDNGGAATMLRKRVQQVHQFSLSAKHMRRLMVDELAESKSAEVQSRLRDINAQAVEAYRSLLALDGGKSLRQVNPLFLYLMVVGIFDFFVSSEPMVHNAAPDGTKIDELSAEFEDFVADILLNGLRKR